MLTDNIVYAILCAQYPVTFKQPGTTLANSKTMYPDLYAAAAGEGNANNTALVAQAVTSVQTGTLIDYVAQNAAPTANDLATAITKINSLSTTVNNLLAELVEAGHMAGS